MAFKTQDVEEQVFDSLEDLRKHLSAEKDRFSMVPIRNFVEKGAVFLYDEHYGSDENYVCFNEDGFRSFCSTFKLPAAFLYDLPNPGLASMNLNDYFSRDDSKVRLCRYSFVLDSVTMAVAGVVTNSYLGFSNATFVDEVEEALPGGFGNYEFETSYLINTRLHLRLLSQKIKAGAVSGSGGVGTDVSRIGIECRNSLVGDSAIRVLYFVHRLICANGLTVPSKNSGRGSVHHRGKPETFSMRIEKNILSVIRSLGRTAKFIEKLMEVPYSTEKLVAAGGAKEVYKVFALYQSERAERQKLTGKRIRQFDLDKISQYPERFGGELTDQVFNSPYRDNQSMFDFVNIFTEFAKTQPPRKRLETEEKAGNLASWIMKNKRKFL
ncbi:MAG: hypothetical protein CEE38_17265 [Planctomycetes bacterium B3_Pla]|nr:MAG: hypothetical protein CEE38_17265 [Planctomycetes bacterium B3_Pla]